MADRLKNVLKSLLSSTGLFVGRQFANRVTGYELARDLNQIVKLDNPLCFDVGANRGQTIELLQDCFRHPVIHAFEPASTTYADLQKRQFGSSVHLHPIAFGERVEAAEFRNYKHSELNSFLTMNRDHTENLFAEEELVQVETVQVDTLDRFCAEHGIEHIDLLKIDTQGFELPVLRGGENLLRQKRVGAVLLELNFSLLYEGQSDYLQLMTLLRAHGLRLIDLYEKERISGRELSWATALFA
ncbi:MAG: FkbM family methyltransferase [Cytophagales bacterium]|nr:MAG: FkbM family methyltransferase [Cytophagales bacterium]